MAELRKGRQTPTDSVTLPYFETQGQQAIDLYNQSGRTAQEWQELLICDILAINEDGLWTHTKFGYSVPRRNGKNEIVAIREIYGLTHGEKILHTAHRTTTSSSASKRLADILNGIGYQEIARPKKGEKYEKAYTYSKQFGLERITILDEGGGSCDFRTRSSKGGLGVELYTILSGSFNYSSSPKISFKNSMFFILSFCHVFICGVTADRQPFISHVAGVISAAV